MVDKIDPDPEEYAAEYGVLKGDLVFIRNNQNLGQAIEEIQQTLANVNREYDNYANLTLEEKVRFDSLCAFCVNALFWMHEKLLGRPNTVMDDIKADLDRVREAMKRLQMVHDNLTKRPHIDKPAAKRFIRAGLYDGNSTANDKADGGPPNKKKRDKNKEAE
uniref:Nuclear nucleic acid-binding protein C1D n=1 Tax=Anopheles culicifacies TaxID=139723 RepID=A0A182LTQ1_9DIPT